MDRLQSDGNEAQKPGCIACGSADCRSASGGVSSPVRCFLTSEGAAQRANQKSGIHIERFSDFGYTAAFENPKPRGTCFGPGYRSNGRPLNIALPTTVVPTNTLGGLPIDIILDIADQLSNLSLYSLRLTCRRFYVIFQERRPSYEPKEEEKQTLGSMLLRASFRHGCTLEWFGRLLHGYATRGPRRKAHRKAAFTSEQLAASATERSCMCAQGVIEVCNPKYITINELGKSLSDLDVSGSSTICADISHTRSFEDIPCVFSLKGIIPYISWSACGPTHSSESLGRWLSRLTVALCPHLDPAFLHKYLTRKEGAKGRGKLRIPEGPKAVLCS